MREGGGGREGGCVCVRVCVFARSLAPFNVYRTLTEDKDHVRAQTCDR